MNVESRSVIDILLDLKPQALPRKEVKIKRLSKLSAYDVIFEVSALPYSTISYIRGEDDDEISLNIVTEGLISPSLRDPKLLEHYGSPTPFELLRNPAFLLPGEVEDLQREIELLSGYRGLTIEDVKKN